MEADMLGSLIVMEVFWVAALLLYQINAFTRKEPKVFWREDDDEDNL